MWLDLILMKPGVYRHLLFNSGSSPRLAGQSPGDRINIEPFDPQDQVDI